MSKLKASADHLYEEGNSLDEMAKQCSNTTDDVSRAVEEISKGAVSQAEEIQNASGQIAQMGTVIEDIVTNVNNLTEASDAMGKAGDESTETMKNLSASNDKTSEAIGMIGEQIRLTDESIKKISVATELITDKPAVAERIHRVCKGRRSGKRLRSGCNGNPEAGGTVE